MTTGGGPPPNDTMPPAETSRGTEPTPAGLPSSIPGPPPLASAVVLVGLPGVGKTTAGEGLARRLGWDLVDLDREIERREGRAVSRIFAEEGEAYFRARERELTRELAGRRGLVVAPGGGWAAQPGLMALLRPPATIIYLAASPAVAVRRMGGSRAARPLLEGGDPVARLARLLADREERYREADHVIDTEILDEQGVIDILAALATAAGAR